jgi:hypothetical protein
MDVEIVIAGMSLFGTLSGTLIGYLTSNKLMMYRIGQLEHKMDKHNDVIERTYALERDSKTAFKYIEEIRADIRELRHDCVDLEG